MARKLIGGRVPRAIDVIFGENPDVDTGTVPETIWQAGGTYTWPTVAAATTIESNSAEDDATKTAPVGTGAYTVEIFGLDADGAWLQETVSLTGTVAVTLANTYYRVNKVTVLTAGSTGSNVGILLVKIGATTVAHVAATLGRSTLGLYTVPANYGVANIAKMHFFVGAAVTAWGEVLVRIRPNGGAWVTLYRIAIPGASTVVHDFETSEALGPLTDIEVRAVSVSADNTRIGCIIEMELY
jgi:hypothetical protein